VKEKGVWEREKERKKKKSTKTTKMSIDIFLIGCQMIFCLIVVWFL